MSSKTNWRELILPNLGPVPTESATSLAMTTIFEMNGNGEAQNIILSKKESNWSINFKKAIVALFVTRVAEGKGLVQTNTVSRDKSIKGKTVF